MASESESHTALGIEFEEKTFYGILKLLMLKYDFTYSEDQLIKLAKAVKAVKAELKVDLIPTLTQYRYSPVDHDEVYQETFQQTENFKKNRVL